MKNLLLTLLAALTVTACGGGLGGAGGGGAGTGGDSLTGAPVDDFANQDLVVQKVDKDDVRDIIQQEKMLAYDNSDNEMIFGAVGEGIAPLNTISAAQALALAKRAALADAYRQLAGKLFGVKVNGKDTVKDAMLTSSTITAQVNGLIKNASVVEESFSQGLYRVNVELKIDAQKWKELFAD